MENLETNKPVGSSFQCPRDKSNRIIFKYRRRLNTIAKRLKRENRKTFMTQIGMRKIPSRNIKSMVSLDDVFTSVSDSKSEKKYSLGSRE